MVGVLTGKKYLEHESGPLVTIPIEVIAVREVNVAREVIAVREVIMAREMIAAREVIVAKEVTAVKRAIGATGVHGKIDPADTRENQATDLTLRRENPGEEDA
jgi:hypothetical protein